MQTWMMNCKNYIINVMNENNIDDRYTASACKEIRMKVMNYHYNIQRALWLRLISNQRKILYRGKSQA